MTNTLHVKKFVLGALGTNCYLAYTDDSKKGVLIDPAVPSEGVKEFIKKERIKVLHTINTHGHADHIGGNAYFGFPVLIHEEDEKFLTDPVSNLSALLCEDLEQVKHYTTVKDHEKIQLGDVDIQILHTPGHTPGSISLKAGDILFSGDTLFFESMGRFDLSGGSRETIKKSIKEKLFTLPEGIVVYPGHGQSTSIAHEKANNPFFT